MRVRQVKAKRINKIKELLNEVCDIVYDEGYSNGYKAGVEDATKHVKKQYAPAISDGVRKGSSECGTALNSYKKY